MTYIKPYFSIPDYIPLIGGQYGPFINTNITKQQQIKIFSLFVITLILIFIFGSIAYKSSKIKHENDQMKVTEEPNPIDTEPYSFGKFINLPKLLDPKSLMVGMCAGIVFGIIDNGGLWFGMDALDPLFDPNNVPWVYGYGGKRQYSGLDSSGNSVYYGVKFKDGILEEDYKINNYKPEQISKKLSEEYYKVSQTMKKLNNMDKNKYSDILNINEKAFADPNSELFLGSNMTKKEFFINLSKHKINENMYESKIKSSNNKENWPGKNKKLAQAWKSGWRPGKLTQSGIGNTYSDFLGSFLATFVGVLIYNMTEISNVSLLSEVIGIVIGCIIGIIIPRLFLYKLSYKT